MRLNGKVAVVTGAASGLGEATAKLLAKEGAKVVIADVQDEPGKQVVRTIQDTGGDATFVHADVTKQSDMDNAVKVAEKQYGKLTTMVANAGIVGRGSYKMVTDITDEEFYQIINVNLLGVLHAFKAAAPAIKRAGGGAMSATSSLSAQLGMYDISVYAASKGGVISLCKALAYELFPDNIRVNCVLPGGMRTNLSKNSSGRTPEEVAAWKNKRSIPASNVYRKMCDPIEVAQAHLFLCSDESSFMTGQALIVDGGWFNAAGR